MNMTKFFSGLFSDTMKVALRHQFDGGASDGICLSQLGLQKGNRVASSKGVQVQQATNTDASMAKQGDRVLSVLETFEQRLSMQQRNLKKHHKQLGYGIRDHLYRYLVVDACSQVLVSNVGGRGIKSTAVL